MGCVSSKSLDSVSSHSSHAANRSHGAGSPSVRLNSFLPGPPSNQLDPYRQGLVGAARWPDDAPGLNISNKSHTPQNREYCTKMYQAAREAGGLIANGSIDSFDSLWNCATKWRLSSLKGDPTRNAFATERVSGTRFITVLNPPYQSVSSRILNHAAARDEVLSHHLLGESNVKVYRQYGRLSGTMIPMTTLSAVRVPRELSNSLKQLKRNVERNVATETLKSDHPNRIEHTDADYLPMIKNHLGELFSQVTDPSLTRRDVIELVARIHWWSASAAPDQRGSAAKSEFTARAIANSYGIELPPFRHGHVPDIEAMLRSEEEFVADYRNLLESEPI